MGTGSNDFTKREYETLAAFRYALRRFQRFSEESASLAGLTPQQHQALLAIHGFPGKDCITVGELRERLQLRSHSVVGLVNRLVVQKWVVRRPSSADRRRVHIQLTNEGTNLLHRVTATHWEHLRRVGPELSATLAALCRDSD